LVWHSVTYRVLAMQMQEQKNMLLSPFTCHSLTAYHFSVRE
jgi:hypothetical protein